MKHFDVSLIVCTRNRCRKLASLLPSITRAVAAAPNVAIEAIIVENASSDATTDVLTGWGETQSFSVRILHEAQPGLARARNCGLRAARGAIIAMTDDDCVLHADYFAALVQCFREVAGSAIIGGRILPGDPADLPLTIKLEDHPMTAAPGAFPGGFVMGANLAFTADVLTAIGNFDERFGAGADFLAAEDTDFVFRAMCENIPIHYDPRFVVDHHHGRRAIDEETQLLAGYGYGDGALYAKHLFRNRRIVSALITDVGNLRRDLSEPVTIHRGVRYFYAFRLFHKLRGFAQYARTFSPTEYVRREGKIVSAR